MPGQIMKRQRVGLAQISVHRPVKQPVLFRRCREPGQDAGEFACGNAEDRRVRREALSEVAEGGKVDGILRHRRSLLAGCG